MKASLGGSKIKETVKWFKIMMVKVSEKSFFLFYLDLLICKSTPQNVLGLIGYTV